MVEGHPHCQTSLAGTISGRGHPHCQISLTKRTQELKQLMALKTLFTQLLYFCSYFGYTWWREHVINSIFTFKKCKWASCWVRSSWSCLENLISITCPLLLQNRILPAKIQPRGGATSGESQDQSGPARDLTMEQSPLGRGSYAPAISLYNNFRRTSQLSWRDIIWLK